MPREVISPEEEKLTHLLTIARMAENSLLEVIRELIRMREEERKKPRMLMVTPEEHKAEKELKEHKRIFDEERIKI